MVDDLVLASLEIAAAELTTAQAAWVVGVGRLGDVDLSVGSRPGDLADLAELATAIGDFPLGPIAYATGEPLVDVREEFHTATYRLDHGGNPYLEVLLGLGPGGITAIGGTRNGLLSETDTHAHPGHVLLADVEAKLGDLVSLLLARAALLDHHGPISYTLTVTDAIDGHPLTLRHLDRERGTLLQAPDPGPFGLLSGETHTDAPFEEQYAATLAVATEAARRFGADRLELLMPVERVGFDRFRDRFDSRYEQAARLRSARA
ncbi:hypothetical protein [Agilicoccus flavus]|uniref:hypothetical protein n=1 Tax=Agilicoccus flavus TaxID=2775968 RepID=UPI001CF6F84D|nr:hypothetical protein [Agilicoccus flavus]